MIDRCEKCNASLGSLTQDTLPGVKAKTLCVQCETNERAGWMLKAIDGATGLSEWEEDFVESVRGQYARKGSLTEKQYLRLEEIYGKVDR
jgi:hypothetical protein